MQASIRWLPLVAAAGAAVLILLASYVVARTPGDAIDEHVVDDDRSPIPSAGSPVAYTLAKDRSASAIGADLQSLGVIRSGKQFQLLVSIMGVQARLSAGDYQLARGLSVASAVAELAVREAVPTVRVTFPEGIRIEEMAVLAEKAGFGTADAFLQAAASAKPPAEIASSLPPGATLQGFLFPDTYIMPAGSTAAQLVDFMLQTFLRRVTPEIRAALTARRLSLFEGVTLASIVEREAAVSAERPLIAGVFFNRLAAGDVLGADPTVQFAVALDPASVQQYGWWKRDLTVDDLVIDSPYNTRTHAGLPPGPITNPGLAAIEAVARPADTDYYYFVANAKAGDGSHVFAVTFEEHERNIAEYGQP